MGRIEVKPAGQRGGVNRRSPDRRLRPTVTALEGRTLLSTWTVTKAGNDDGSSGTLSWAVGKANADGGGDTIVFDSNVFATAQKLSLIHI